MGISKNKMPMGFKRNPKSSVTEVGTSSRPSMVLAKYMAFALQLAKSCMPRLTSRISDGIFCFLKLKVTLKSFSTHYPQEPCPLIRVVNRTNLFTCLICIMRIHGGEVRGWWKVRVKHRQRQGGKSVGVSGESQSQLYHLGCPAGCMWRDRTETNRDLGPILEGPEFLHRKVDA